MAKRDSLKSGEIVAISRFNIVIVPSQIGSDPMGPTIGMKIGMALRQS